MIVELEKLILLQERDLEIRVIKSRLRQIPEEVARLEQEVATERANAKAADDRLNGSKKARRALESELELAETKMRKYKDQLMLVKTNDEYRAMQKQIETVKEEIRDKEDGILAKMEEIERLHEELNQRGRELEKGLAEVKQLEAQLEAEGARLSAELERRNAEREELLGAIPSELLEIYHQIGRIRGGVAVAEAKDEHCQVCHVRLRPQVYTELRLGTKLLRCENCSRFLYYLEQA